MVNLLQIVIILFVLCLPTEHLGIHKNSLKHVRAFQIELLEMLDFKERGRSECLEQNLQEQGREPTTNSTKTWCRRQDMNPGHIGGRRVLSPLRHPLLPEVPIFAQGIVEWAKRERAWKSPHARKARRGAFLAWVDFHGRSRFACSTIPEQKWGLLVVYPE